MSGVVDLSAERARRANGAPPPVEPLFFAAEIIEQYGQALFVHGYEHEGGDGPSDEESEEALVLARQVGGLPTAAGPPPGAARGGRLTPYATQADMVDRHGTDDLVRLTDRAGQLDAIDAAVLSTALKDATAEINGYLAKRYADRLPFADPPRVLVTHCCSIAWYRLQGDHAGASAQRLYDLAVSFLRQVARGEASLGDEDPADSQQSSPGPVVEEGPERVFSRDSLKGF